MFHSDPDPLPSGTSGSGPRAVRGRLLLAAGAAFLTALAAVLLVLGAARPPSFHGTAWEPPQPAEEFALIDHRGRTATLSSFRGTTVLLFFGFVNCPDICPLTLARLSRAIETLRADTTELRVLLVTVDPERDSPEALAEYVARFAPHVVGLTGEAETLAAVRSSFHAYAGAHPGHDGNVSVMHTTQVFGIDRRGMIRVLISPEFDEERLRADIRTLMRF